MKKTPLLFICIFCVLFSACQRGTGLSPELEIDIDAGYKSELLEKYAPVIYFHPDEPFYPSSVEWAFKYQKRLLDPGGMYRLYTRAPIQYTESWGSYTGVVIQPFFYGNLESATLYAYWVEKPNIDAVDLVYFVYYPYNHGKMYPPIVELARCYNHVGDWENIAVRLKGRDSLIPEKIRMEAHGNKYVHWWDADTIKKYQETHPIVYSAYGGHGVWESAGSHTYFDFFISLIDYTGEGIVWHSWEKMEMYDLKSKKGIGTSEWPVWMSSDFSHPGTGDPANPASGAIKIWGNPGQSWALGDILVGGPTGPIDKSVLRPDYNW